MDEFRVSVALVATFLGEDGRRVLQSIHTEVTLLLDGEQYPIYICEDGLIAHVQKTLDESFPRAATKGCMCLSVLDDAIWEFLRSSILVYLEECCFVAVDPESVYIQDQCIDRVCGAWEPSGVFAYRTAIEIFGCIA